MTLADTPKNWPEGPGISTLHALLLFAGIPLLVIIAVSLMVLAPGWVKGPRYRPGQPWDAKSEWFGVEPRPSTTEPTTAEGAEAASAARADIDDGSGTRGATRRTSAQGSGGASAGW